LDVIDVDEPVQISILINPIISIPLSFYNFLNDISNNITIIDNNLRSSIINSKDNSEIYKDDLNWSDLFRIQATGPNGWMSSGIINYINKLQMQKYKKQYNINNNENLPFFIFPSYEILDNNFEFQNYLNDLKELEINFNVIFFLELNLIYFFLLIIIICIGLFVLLIYY
jgi:hypothetical protein